MHKISCFKRAETDVYRRFLPRPRHRHQDLSVGPSVIDPNEGMLHYKVYIFVDTYHSRAGEKLKRPTKESFHVFSFDDTEEKVAVRFEG